MKNFYLCLFVLLSVLISYPYIIECLIDIPPISVIGPILLIITFFFLCRCRKSKGEIPDFIFITLFFQILSWTLYSIIHNDATYITRVFFVVWASVIILLLVRNGCLKDFICLNNKFIAIQAVGGAISFILIFAGLLKPVVYYTLQNGQYGYCYILTCTNVAFNDVIRMAGYFDEPGAMAFWGIFALMFNKLFIQNRKIEYCLMVCLIFTMSAAYFVQLLLYILFFFVNNIKRSIPILLVFLSIIYIGLKVANENPIIAKYTTERFKDGQIKSTRYYLADTAKKYFLANPLFGIGGQKMEDIEYMADNPYEIFAKDGIIGFVVTYAVLFITALRIKGKSALFAIVILSVGYLQRPFHMNLIHYLNLYIFCILLYDKYGIKRTKHAPKSFSYNGIL